MSDFCLTDEQWNVVVSTMATFDHSATDENRAEIEATCRAFIGRRIEVGKSLPKPGKKAAYWKAVADAAQNLREAIETDPEVKEHITLQFRLPNQTGSILMRQIDALRDVATEMAGHVSSRPRTPSAADPDLEQLQKRLISLWSVCGGPIGSSVSSKDNTARGPLVRFLGATYSPALHAAGIKLPSREALREITRKVKLLMEDQLLEALSQVTKGKPFTTHRILGEVEKLRDAGRLKVKTIPLAGPLASRAMWPCWWNVFDPGYWPVALDGWMTALKIHDAANLDDWLGKQTTMARRQAEKAKKSIRVSREPVADNGEPVWKVENPFWPVGIMQNDEDESLDQEDEDQP